MTKPVLLCDMDGPLAEFDALFFERVLERGWQIECTFAERRHRFATDHMVDEAERRLARLMVHEPGWFASLPVQDGAVDGLNELAKYAEVWICTKPLEENPTCRDEKAAWLEQHFGEKWVRRLILAPDKSLVHGQVLLDDAPKPAWFPRATWAPVIFPTPFNGPDSQWATLPRWTWGDDPLVLLEYGARVAAR